MNTSAGTIATNGSITKVFPQEKKAVTWFKSYVNPQNIQHISIDYLAEMMKVLNYDERGLVGASRFLKWDGNTVSVKINSIKNQPNAEKRFDKLILYFPFDKMVEFFSQFSDEHFENVKAVVDARWSRRRRRN